MPHCTMCYRELWKSIQKTLYLVKLSNSTDIKRIYETSLIIKISLSISNWNIISRSHVSDYKLKMIFQGANIFYVRDTLRRNIANSICRDNDFVWMFYSLRQRFFNRGCAELSRVVENSRSATNFITWHHIISKF